MLKCLKSEPFKKVRDCQISEENKIDQLEEDFSVSVNISSGSGKNLIFDICTDYFDFEKKEKKEKKEARGITNLEKIKKMNKEFKNQEKKAEREKKNSYDNYVNSSSYSKLSFSNKNSYDSISMSFEKIDELLYERDQCANRNLKTENHKTFILLDKKKNDGSLTKEEWRQIIANNSFTNVDKEKLIKSLIKGIPQEMRGKIWIVLSKSYNISKNHHNSLFENLVQEKNEKLEHEIKKDLERTILQIDDDKQREFIQTKKSDLNIVLKAYGIKDPEVGYAQGTNFIVLTLLSNLKSSKEAYWVFFQIMFDKSWRFLFTNNTPKLNMLLEKLIKEIKEKIPCLYCIMEKENFVELVPGTFAHFFTSIFTYDVPIKYSYKMLDLFLLLGEMILIDSIIILLKLKENKLIKMSAIEMHIYIKKNLVKDAFNENNMDKLFPPRSISIEEKEISLD